MLEYMKYNIEGDAMRNMMTVVWVCVAIAAAGCENVGTATQSKTNQGALLGGLLGAGTGAIIGNQSGHHAGKGAAIGAGLGALGGGLMGHALEEQDRSLQRQQYPPATGAVAPLAPSTAASETGTATTGRTKFCPVGGEIYPESVKYCPNHGVELRYKDQP